MIVVLDEHNQSSPKKIKVPVIGNLDFLLLSGKKVSQ